MSYSMKLMPPRQFIITSPVDIGYFIELKEPDKCGKCNREAVISLLDAGNDPAMPLCTLHNPLREMILDSSCQKKTRRKGSVRK